MWRDVDVAPDDQIWGVGSLGLSVRGSGTAFASLPALPNKDLSAVAVAGDHVFIFGQSDGDETLWIHQRGITYGKGPDDYDPTTYRAVQIPVDSIRIVDAIVDDTAITIITKPSGSSTASGAWIGTRKLAP